MLDWNYTNLLANGQHFLTSDEMVQTFFPYMFVRKFEIGVQFCPLDVKHPVFVSPLQFESSAYFMNNANVC